jgi:DNA-binding transcriptional LysR family regulator
MHVTLAQLEIFLAAADAQHFTKAAQDLHLTQPAVTFQVRNLERTLGVALFDVRGRRVYLTEGGAMLQQLVGPLLRQVRALEATMHEYATLGAGRLALGATRTIGAYVVPGLLARFRALAPAIELAITVDNTAAIEDLVLARALDLALVEGEVVLEALYVQPFQEDELVVQVRTDDPLASRGTVGIDELRGRSFVCREPGSGTQALAERALGPVFRDAPSILVLESPEAINRAVEADLGLAVQSAVIAERDVAAGRLRALRVKDRPMHRHFSVVHLDGRVLSPAATSFLTMLRGAPPTERPSEPIRPRR